MENDEVLRQIDDSDRRTTINEKTLLSLLTTERVEQHASGSHTRSVLLVTPDSFVDAPVVVDNLQFHLLLSVHEHLPIHELISALHENYFYAHYSEASIQRLKLNLLGPGATTEQLQEPLDHPLYRIAESNNENYHLHRDDEGGGDGDEMRDEKSPVSTLYCIKRWQSFQPNPASKIYNKLKKGRSGTKKSPIQNQWRLQFDNHAVVQYFIDKLQRPLYINRRPCEVRVLWTTSDRRVSYFDYANDTSLQYVLDQLPQFHSESDSLAWSFGRTIPLTMGYIHNSTGDVRRTNGRIALNDQSFQLASEMRLVDFTERVQSVVIDTMSSKKHQKVALINSSSTSSIEKTAEQSALEERNAQQQAIRTSRPKQPIPGQTKRMAQGRLDFTLQCKKSRTETTDTV